VTRQNPRTPRAPKIVAAWKGDTLKKRQQTHHATVRLSISLRS
jgi:hypothetical protein